MAIGRPKKTSEQLRIGGAKPYKVAARKKEEDIEAGIIQKVKDVEIAKRGLLLHTFLQQVKQERDTFFERLVPGQTVCKEYGAEFNWRIERPLTIIRTYVEQIASGEIVSGDYTRREPICTALISALSSWVKGIYDLRSPILWRYSVLNLANSYAELSNNFLEIT